MCAQDFNNEKYVAHYTKFKAVVEYILSNRTIKVNSIQNMNDPYEYKKHWIDVMPSYDKVKEQHSSIEKFSASLMRNIKIFSSTYYKKIENSIGISNKIYCLPRMWAQYGDNHKGVCLIFNKEKLNQCFEKSTNTHKIYNDKIEYLEWLEMINNDLSLDYSHVIKYQENKSEFFNLLDDNFIKSRFFRKHYDWKDENEYRWLVISNDEAELFIDFEDSLEAIFLGCDVNPVYFDLFKSLTIPTYYLGFENSKYTIGKLN